MADGSDIGTADARLYAEDLEIGRTVELGTYTVTAEDIIAFASQWDPQPFHIDHDAAARGFFGEVIGSGIHSLAIYQRLSVLGETGRWAIVAGRRLADARFLSPLRPGTTVHADFTVTAVENTRPERALVTKRARLLDGNMVIMDAVLESYVLRRHPD